MNSLVLPSWGQVRQRVIRQATGRACHFVHGIVQLARCIRVTGVVRASARSKSVVGLRNGEDDDRSAVVQPAVVVLGIIIGYMVGILDGNLADALLGASGKQDDRGNLEFAVAESASAALVVAGMRFFVLPDPSRRRSSKRPRR